MAAFRHNTYDSMTEGSDSKNIDKFICSGHIEDAFIKKHIVQNGKRGKCNYCNKNRNVISFEEFCDLLEVGIDYLFESADESLFYDDEEEHGFAGQTFTALDIIRDDMLHISFDELICSDLEKAIVEDKVYHYVDEFYSDLDQLNGDWLHFKDIVKHKARFVFYFNQVFNDYFSSNPISILNNIQSEISNHNLIQVIDENKKIYRCTQHVHRNDVKNNGRRISSNPYQNCKFNNRMSPAGISMFYGSPHKQTCIEETVNLTDTKNPFFTTAYFTPKNPLRLVNFMNMPHIPSVFDNLNNNHIETIQFLCNFVEDISKPILSTDSIIEYIPTQIVTEYIRYNPDLNVQGIIYPSSRDKSKENYVLFMDHDTCLQQLNFHPRSRIVERIPSKV